MKPVMQTLFFDPDQQHQRGNCQQAIVASLLELPLEDVPHFVQQDVDHDGIGDWHWWTAQWKWLRLQGWSIHAAVITGCPGEYLMVSGPSPRGKNIFHAVIYRDGELAHDPHPDGTGVLSVSSCHVIRRIVAGGDS